MSLKDEILALFVTIEGGNTYYPSGYKDVIIRAGELAEAREKELLATIESFVPHGYLSPDGFMTSMNFDGCQRLYIKDKS
jgi:hypothetical protein